MKSPMLLCFNMSPEKAAKLRLICMRFSIRFQPVPRRTGAKRSARCAAWRMQPRRLRHPKPFRRR